MFHIRFYPRRDGESSESSLLNVTTMLVVRRHLLRCRRLPGVVSHWLRLLRGSRRKTVGHAVSSATWSHEKDPSSSSSSSFPCVHLTPFSRGEFCYFYFWGDNPIDIRNSRSLPISSLPLGRKKSFIIGKSLENSNSIRQMYIWFLLYQVLCLRCSFTATPVQRLIFFFITKKKMWRKHWIQKLHHDFNALFQPPPGFLS